MTTRRKTAKARPQIQELILDTTAAIMTKEGYAAVTTRRVAKEIGMTSGIIHYYFPTTDDLFLALFQQSVTVDRERMIALLAGDNPLQSLWRLSADTSNTALILEFMAMANHRKSIQAQIRAYAEEVRVLQCAAIDTYLRDRNVPEHYRKPAGLAAIISAISRSMVLEEGLGIANGHAEVDALVEVVIQFLTGVPASGS